MGRKAKTINTLEFDRRLVKSKKKQHTPLEKCDVKFNPTEIISDFKKMVEVNFMSDMMLMNYSYSVIKEKYQEKFGKSISDTSIIKLKKLVKMVYLCQISNNRDEQVAEQLMQADWELRELKLYWEKSKEGKNKTASKKSSSSGDSPEVNYELKEDEEIKENTYGDLEAMKRIDIVQKRIISVLGLEAPKIQQETNNTLPTVVVNLVGTNTKKIQVEDVNAVNE